MKKSILWALTLLAFLFTGACGKKTRKATAENGGGLSCVLEKEVACTKDLNACGNPGSCECPAGFEYNGSVGKCLLKDISSADGTAVKLPDSECVSTPTGACTKDRNACGFSSSCECPEGTEYDQRIGKCVKPL